MAIATLATMVALALRADRRLAIGKDSLPMNFAPDGTVLWRAPRRVALAVMPVLALVIFVPFALFAPNTPGALIASLSLLGGQIFYHHLIGRAA